MANGRGPVDASANESHKTHDNEEDTSMDVLGSRRNLDIVVAIVALGHVLAPLAPTNDALLKCGGGKSVSLLFVVTWAR